jgi:hypothetical protein
MLRAREEVVLVTDLECCGIKTKEETVSVSKL